MTTIDSSFDVRQVWAQSDQQSCVREPVIFRTSRKHLRRPMTTSRYSAELEAAIRAGELIDEEKFGLARPGKARVQDRLLHLAPDLRVT